MLARVSRLAFARLYSVSSSASSTHRASQATAGTMSKGEKQQQDPNSSQESSNKKPLPLPSPDDVAAAGAEAGGRGDGVTALRVGESVRLDALGPLVVNTDGSMGRVGNWAGMTEGEREATLRLLGRRNKQRLEALKAKRAAEEQEQK
ncbi:hypothetical protein FDECE_17126 [Fusarium decemcellulare]|nr:hypothetical protein FDECE_17126 [Fusarium decemcellulare]